MKQIKTSKQRLLVSREGTAGTELVDKVTGEIVNAVSLENFVVEAQAANGSGAVVVSELQASVVPSLKAFTQRSREWLESMRERRSQQSTWRQSKQSQH